MNKVFMSLLSALFAASTLAGCAEKLSEAPLMPVIDSNISTFSTGSDELPVFSKRQLGTMNIHTNSNAEQVKKQLKLHGFYFKSYSNGHDSYAVTDTNDHMKMLQKAEKSINVALDDNKDNKVTLDEINKFVSSAAFIKYFRETFITFSFNKLDKSADKNLNVDEFNQFNAVIKAKELPDFQLLEEFAEYDYNSSRALDFEEYEDFFMKYLLIKVGATKR
jgi:hypothetical protein